MLLLLSFLTGLGNAEPPQKWPQQDFLDISANKKVLMRFQEAVTDVDSTLGCIQIQMRRILADQSNVVHETVLSNFLLPAEDTVLACSIFWPSHHERHPTAWQLTLT